MADPNVNTQAEILANVRNKALEEAAAICDEASDLHANGEDWMRCAEFCASDIRALKTKERA